MFPDSKIAHKYLDGLVGIEVGASAHNPFNLNTINVDSERTYKNYIDEQIKLAGQTAKIDVFADACKLPFADKEFDFVINSHVIDRIWRPDLAIKEWCRVAKQYIFLIIPHRVVVSRIKETTPEEIFNRPIKTEYEDAHHNIWSVRSFLNFISHFKELVEPVETLYTDDKVFNGFCVVLKINSPVPAPVPSPTIQYVPPIIININNIVGFWHICMINQYYEIITEQLNLLINSGLYEKTKNIYVSCVGPESELIKVKDMFSKHEKVIIHSHTQNVGEYEFPCLDIIKEKSDTLHPFAGFYIHTKGVSWPNHEGGNHWKDYMNYYVISRWKDNIDKLQSGYDTCGVKLIPKAGTPMHYSGNFWWAKSEYLKNLKSTSSLNKRDRFEAEMWLCRNNPKAASLCQTFVDYNTKGKFIIPPPPPKKRIVVHTLAYNLTSEVRDAVELLYKQNNSEDFTHVIVDLGFPILTKTEMPDNIDNAKLLNAEENKHTSAKHGSEFMAINNIGVSQNWEMVRKEFKIADNDILICADPDERPKNNGWVKAIADVISNPDVKIGWCSLMMKEHVPLMKKENEKIIDGHKVYIIPNGGFNWAQGGFNGKFLNQIGGVPVPDGAPIYGWIEHACTVKMNKLGYKTAILADYFVEHTECSPLYRAWKTDVTSNVKNGQIDFESWLRKKKR